MGAAPPVAIAATEVVARIKVVGVTMTSVTMLALISPFVVAIAAFTITAQDHANIIVTEILSATSN